MSNSSAVAQQIARGLASSGVTEVVIAPGSRSAPLVYALAPLAEAGILRTHVRIDERDAGFLALGLARGLRTVRGRRTEQSLRTVRGPRGEFAQSGPVALVTTSGSAVANLHPAILEASYGHLPLIAITADRPARLRGTGANQTIDDQAEVLSDVRARFDVPAGGLGPQGDEIAVEALLAEAVVRAVGELGGVGARASGPVQFNVQFDVPLVPTETELADWRAELASRPTELVSRSSESESWRAENSTSGGSETEPRCGLRITEDTIIVGGDAGGHPAKSLRDLAARHRLPVLAEPSSSLSFHDSATFVPAHAAVLTERGDLREAIDTVIVHGKPTLTRPVAALLADDRVRVQHLPDDVDALSLEVAVGTSSNADRTTWCEGWTNAGHEIAARAEHDRQAEHVSRSTPGSVARAITERLAASPINLFVASSNSIRYLSEVTEVRAAIHASRGLAGIDGLVSTATGLSLGLGERVVLLIGDVAMLHDIGGLLTPSGEPLADVDIVVLNDDGGAIFSGLEHSQPHVVPYLERYFRVPHGRGFGALASAYGWEYAQMGDYEEFLAEWSRPGDGVADRRILEVRLT